MIPDRGKQRRSSGAANKGNCDRSPNRMGVTGELFAVADERQHMSWPDRKGVGGIRNCRRKALSQQRGESEERSTAGHGIADTGNDPRHNEYEAEGEGELRHDPSDLFLLRLSVERHRVKDGRRRGLEYAGDQWHSSVKQQERDETRRTELDALGWHVIR